MTKLFTLVALCTLVLMSTTFAQGQDEVVLSFISVNGYGNNLYVDNITVGNQFATDIAVSSINNIAPDTSYSVNGTSGFVVAPKVSVTNVGRTNIAVSFNVTFAVTPGAYTSTRSISLINRGQSQELTFDDLTITPNTPIQISVYANLGTDDNRANDTLRQYTLVLPGVQRNVLFEEWTSSTCAPCASNNPSLDAFIAQRRSSIVPVKYHVGWPSPGNDPMYLHNPTQSYDRRYYYGINAVPTLVVDGQFTVVSGFTTLSNLETPYNACMGMGTPVEVTVTDTRLTNDTVQADVAVEILSPLAGGNYKLRIEAAERTITYATPPGSNGEMVFNDVFRHSYPTSDGTVINTSVGVHHYIFKYKIDTAVWVDSMIYTIAYVQNDANKQVLNCNKARATLAAPQQLIAANDASGKDMSVATDMPFTSPIVLHAPDGINGGFNFELFEGSFPAAGWSLVNPDGGITFAQFPGANGPAMGGTKSARVNCYSYGTSGAVDTLYTRVFTGLDGSDTVKFDWAYAVYPGYSDRLIVKLSKDGGRTFPYTVFDKAGDVLATAPSTTGSFVPGSSQWGSFAYSLFNIVSDVGSETSPATYLLEQNYPNPFNPSTTIRYSLAEPGGAALVVYDVIGREVARLVDGMQDAGRHEVAFDAGNLSSGVYFYTLRSGGFTATRKLMFVK